MNIIKTEDLEHSYIKKDENGIVVETVKVLNGINIEIEAGQFIGILGNNGSGKSTFALHLNGILLPSKGTVWVGEKDLQKLTELWDVRSKIGLVFQNPDNQIVSTLVEDDVGFGLENIGVETEDIWERVEDSLRMLGMWEYREFSTNELSGGQKQRVAIAGVLAMQPQCIVLDEPTSFIDPIGRRDLIKYIQYLTKEKGITVILITHNMDEVIFADKIFVMDKGSIAMDGTPREIFSKVDELKKYNLEVPQVTLLAYELKKAGLKISDCILTIDELVEELCL